MHSSLPWSDLKLMIDSGASFRYFSTTDSYIIFIVDIAIIFRTDIVKDGGADQLDFENNYQANANPYLRAPVTYALSSNVNSISSSATSVTLLSSNSLRKGGLFFNNSTQNCYVKYGTTASTSSFTIKMEPQSTLILDVNPIYTGRIDGIWDSANGTMLVTELT